MLSIAIAVFVGVVIGFALSSIIFVGTYGDD